MIALTPKRLHLLRNVRHHQVRDVGASATRPGRKRAEELTKLGLLARTADRVVAPYGRVDSRLVL